MTTRPIKVWDGTAWIDVGVYGPDTSGFALTANNLSDLANTATALSNLGGTPTSRTISAGTGLTGGGDLSANRTVSIAAGGVGTTELAAGAVTAAKSSLSATDVGALPFNNYVPPVPTNGYMTYPATSVGAVTLSAGEIRTSYLWLPAGTLVRIGVDISTASTAASGGLVRLGIYNDNGSLTAPGSLVLDAGTASTETTGIKEITISQTITAGYYWLVAAIQVASCAPRSMATLARQYSPTVTTYLGGSMGAQGVGFTGITGALGTLSSGTQVSFPSRVFVRY